MAAAAAATATGQNMCNGFVTGDRMVADDQFQRRNQGRDVLVGEPLVPEHRDHITITNSAGTTLCYNQSSLRAVAEVYGAWMQPPYFREEMEAELAAKCEALGGPLQMQPGCVAGPKRLRSALGSSLVLGKQASDACVRRIAKLSAHVHDISCFAQDIPRQQLFVCQLCYAKLVRELVDSHNIPDDPASHDPLMIIMMRGETHVFQFCARTKALITGHLKSAHGIDQPVSIGQSVGAKLCPQETNCTQEKAHMATLRQVIETWLDNNQRAHAPYAVIGSRAYCVDSNNLDIPPSVHPSEHKSFSANWYWRSVAGFNAHRYARAVAALDDIPLRSPSPLFSDGFPALESHTSVSGSSSEDESSSGSDSDSDAGMAAPGSLLIVSEAEEVDDEEAEAEAEAGSGDDNDGDDCESEALTDDDEDEYEDQAKDVAEGSVAGQECDDTPQRHKPPDDDEDEASPGAFVGARRKRQRPDPLASDNDDSDIQSEPAKYALTVPLRRVKKMRGLKMVETKQK